MVDMCTVNPYIRVAMHSVLHAGGCVKQRIIFDYELIYIENGEFTLVYAGKSYQCKPGQFILIRPGVTHEFKNILCDLSQPHIHFDMIYTSASKRTFVCFKDYPALTPEEKALVQKDLFDGYPQTPFIVFKNTDESKKLFFDVINLNKDNSRLAAKGMLTVLISRLIGDNFPEAVKPEKSSISHIAQQIKDYIDSVDGVGISLESLEKQFCYNRFYLEHRFREQYKTGIIAYAGLKKYEKACELLSEMSVSDVSDKLGFGSIYSFSRFFKNKTGVSPSEYAKKS